MTRAARPKPGRRAVALAAVVASLVLSGCTVDATIVIGDDDMVAVDVTGWVLVGRGFDELGHSSTWPQEPCDPWHYTGQLTGLTYSPLTDPGYPDAVGCHITGNVPLAEVSRWYPLGRVDDRYVVSLSSNTVHGFTDPTEVLPPSAKHSRISVTFPGAVESQDAQAIVSGRTVTWPDLSAVEGYAGIAAMARRGGPDGPDAGSALGGALAGAAAVAGAGFLFGRRRKDDE